MRVFYATFQAIVKVTVAVEPPWPVQVVFCEVLVQEGDDIKSDLTLFAPLITPKTFRLIFLLFLSRKGNFKPRSIFITI